MNHSLSILLWLPLAAGVLGLLLPGRAARWVVLLGSLLTLGYAISLLVDYESGRAGLQFVTNDVWIKQLGIHYKLGVDGLNVVLLTLTAVLFVGAFLWAGRQEWERPKLFWFWFALMETGVIGAFLAQDLILFVAFFDLMLVPVLFLTGQWGEEGRAAAITKLFIYTLAGSLLMLAAAVATGILVMDKTGAATPDFQLSSLAATPLGKGSQEWIFLCFAAAFLVKMPAFPFHGWMPDGYKAMPIAVLAVFSAILSKVAAYGFLRVVLPTFPDASAHFQTLMLILALCSILYGSAMAFTVTNTRLVLGYSSIAQLGFIVLGVFALQHDGAQGAILQSVNHALVVAPLLFIVALLAKRAGSEDLRDMGGLAFRAPILAAVFLVFALATLAIPGSSNFAGEFLILLGVFHSKLAISIIAFAGVVMASVYALRVYIRSMHNRVGPNVQSRELSLGDGVVLVPLVLLVLALALYPQFALKRSDVATRLSVQPARISAGLVTPPAPLAATGEPVIVPQTGAQP